MKLSSFSVILIFVVLIIVGAGMLPLLNVQYTPSYKQKSIGLNFYWNGASARVIESEVTSKLEGVISSVKGVSQVNSVSRKDGGSIDITLKPDVNISAVRFEISSLIRQVYPKLPRGVSYPYLSVSSTGEKSLPVITFTLNANLPTQHIEQYADNNIVRELALIDGVNSVILTGATPYYMEISFDPEKLRSFGVSVSELSSSINNSIGGTDIIGSFDEMTILLSSGYKPVNFELIPISNVQGKVIRLQDVAKITYKERLPTQYFRINGLNTINITVYPEKYVNTLELCNEIKSRMKNLEVSFPDSFSAIITYDSSTFLKKEISKIIRRTILCVIILLAFVYLVSRSFRYLLAITIALIANVFIAFILYYVFKMEIHLYSMAGITVSLGIIIDTSIIMISHYGYYKNRKVFIAILAAQLTTIGALAVIFFLPDKQKANLFDFAGVIIINLAVSMAVALLLIPALMDKIHIKESRVTSRFSYRRGIIKLNNIYKSYILFGKRHKWAFILILVLGFGLPVHMLPDKIGVENSYEQSRSDRDTGLFVTLYNRTIGSSFYQDNIKNIAEKTLGGSLRLFLKNISGANYYREPQRLNLNIRASMPEGSTVKQLNEIVVNMENYLTQFDQIEIFKTDISSYNNGSINVTFKKEYENSGFPLLLKQEVIGKAIDFGGANWSVYGIDDQGFNNNIGSMGYKSNRIGITGYNYDQLYSLCQDVIKSLSVNQRVKDPEIFGSGSWGSILSRNEYYIDYDPNRMALLGLSLTDGYSALQEQLFRQSLSSYFDGKVMEDVVLASSNIDNFDVWHLNNEYIKVGDKSLRFSEIGSIDKRRTGNDIYKKNQQYALTVGYDFIGSYNLSKKVIDKEIERLNSSVLPIGFKAKAEDYGWGVGESKKIVWILLYIIVVIYLVCAVLFESLVQPFIIILLIPMSFIGVFLTFYFTGFSFDQGGFASLVMLSGIVVNAGIYIINQSNLQQKYGYGRNRSAISNYIRAYNHKIVPILLTIISTVLGLIPFLFDGKSEVFWFAFAVGTMGGLLFSIIALVFFMPVWLPE